jgi:hypothetical protein
MTKGRRVFPILALLAAVAAPVAAQAASRVSWDGTWVGVINDTEPVSVTISGGKVVSYAIRGGQPFGIGYSQITRQTVSFGDRENYDVKITRVGDTTASGFAHSPLGNGSATLTRR